MNIIRVARASRRAASTFVSTFDLRFRPAPVCASQDIDMTVDAARLEARAT
jgi:hypothetical protein